MIEETSPEIKDSICESLCTSLENIQDGVKNLQEWMKTQPHLPQTASDSLLTNFLVACKCRLEDTKQKINNFYTARENLPEFFRDRDPRNGRFQEVGREIQLFLLPKTTPDGCDVMMTRLATGDTKKYDVTVFTTRFLAQEDLKMESKAFTKGRYFVIDGTNFSVSHLLKLSPKLLRSLICCAQDVLPINIKGVIFINAPATFDLLFNLVKPFFKNKVLKRFHIYTDGPEVLNKYFPTSILPKDYGGLEPTSEFLNERWLGYLEEKRDWLLREGKLEYKEGKTKPKKRKEDKTEKLKKDTSFRNLNID